jgi:hypothetical protein
MGPDMARLLKSGGEVLPLSGWWLAASIPVIAAWIGAAVYLLRHRDKFRAAHGLFFGVSILALIISLRAARMFDYFVPFAALFAASVLSPLIPSHREKSAYAFGFAYLLAAASLIPSLTTVRNAPSVDRYRSASNFLATLPGRPHIWNTEWQQYPFLYFWNPDGRYVTGMEPALFYRADPARYWKWRKLADDAVDDSATLDSCIFDDFHATHIVVDRKVTPRLAAQLAAHPRIAEVFHDSELSVFSLRAN